MSPKGGRCVVPREEELAGLAGQEVNRVAPADGDAETGFPVVPNFAPGFIDPCQTANIANNPNRPANCLADLGALFGTLPMPLPWK